MKPETTKIIDPEPAMLSREEEQELSDALAEIHAGRFVDGWALLDELRAQAERERPAAGHR